MWAAGGALAARRDGRALRARRGVGARARPHVYLFLIGMMALRRVCAPGGRFHVGRVGGAGRRARVAPPDCSPSSMGWGSSPRPSSPTTRRSSCITAGRSRCGPAHGRGPGALRRRLRADRERASLILPIATVESHLLRRKDARARAWFRIVRGSIGRIDRADLCRAGVDIPPLDCGAARRQRQAPRYAATRGASVTLGLSAIVLVATARAEAVRSEPWPADSESSPPSSLRRGARRPAAHRAPGSRGSIVVLTAGLFVLVDALEHAGADSSPRQLFTWPEHHRRTGGRRRRRASTAGGVDLLNNLRSGSTSAILPRQSHPATALVSRRWSASTSGQTSAPTARWRRVLWLAIFNGPASRCRRCGSRPSASSSHRPR